METRLKWQPFKELYDVTQQFALQKQASVNQIKLLLRRHKPEFLSFFKNPSRNTEDRNALKNKSAVFPFDAKLLDDDFCDEALIISDLFELNELASAELLFAGEEQKPNYANYTRGLVAVLLYWDGRRNLVSALRTLIQCRQGRSWTLDLSEEGVGLATSFTDELLENGLTQRILELLCEIDTERELEKLGKQKGLGDARHRRQIRDLITEVRQCLADCLFYFAGQSGLPQNDVKLIFEHLRRHSEVESDETLSSSTLALLFAAFYAITLPSDMSQDGSNVEDLLKHPILADKEFIPTIHKLLVHDRDSWNVSGVCACLLLVWSLTLRTISQSSFITSMAPVSGDILEQDEEALEKSLADQVFLYLKENVIKSPSFRSEEFYVRRVHEIVIEIIVNMPLKVKEMRNHGDEVARILMLHLVKGEEPPRELRKDFLQFLELITSLYDNDPLDIQLSADFWFATEHTVMSDGSYMAAKRLPHKQMALFKFIRQSADMLPPLLYIPYIHMLSALSTGAQSSRAAFEMLRTNGGNGESMISWDHFFTSCHRYYDNLRQDLPSPHETTSPFPTQPFSSQTSQRTCTITPHEVEGLRAVMQLVAKVAQYDDIACVAFYEDTHWSVCGILFGLMQCPVPIRLKGEIMAALSHMARIPDIALGLLQACETSQLLQSLPALGKPLGITAELAEVESREEQYPMTQGFIKLLSALSNLQGLGGGFTRYLLFVVESVFLPLLSRAYSRSEEKWEVASASLEFFNRLLSNYHPLPEHFQEKATTLHESSSSVVASSRKLPAFAFLQHIYHEGNFFKIVMQIIEQCITYLDTYITKHDLERTLVEAAERALQLILNALELQEVFVSALRTSGSSLLITTLDKLLFGINPQTKRADYTINIARLITHNGSHPNLSLLAVQVISWLSFSMSHNQLVTVMMNSCNVATRHKITQGFVEVLDSACFESREADTEEPVISQCRLSIVRILVHSVDLPSPNMSQLLLFDAATNPSQANLQDPGVMGASRSCLHSVLSILSGQSTQPAAIVETPKLAEVCYQLIYRLAYNTETSEPVLRYLRSSHDFIYKHLQYLPFNTDDQVPTNTLMMQQSWLLKTAAIELHSLATKQQRTNAQRLLQVLFSQVKANTSITVNQSMNQSHLTTMMDTTSHSVSFLDTTSVQSSSALTVVRMLDIVDFSQAFPSPLNLDQFIPSVVEEGIKSCESTNEHGVVFCDVKMLHRMLETNLNTLGAEEMNRKRLAVQDMQNILQNVVVKNQMRDTLHAKLHLLTAWKHALEVALTSCPDDLLPRHTRQQVLFNIAQYLLKVTCNSEAAQELISPLAAVMLTLVIQIRSSLMESVDVDRSSISSQDQLLNVASTLATLQIVIKGILDWLLQSGINQKVRVHLYASLLHYLQLCQQNKKQSTGRGNHMTLRAAREDTYTRLNRENVKLLKDYGESFMDLICKDACSGQSICRVLAYGCLDCIVQMDVEQSWLQFMIKNGYINHIANSFLQEDEALQEYLLPNSGPSRAVYIYEQKMALLCSIVHSLGGARAIIDSGVLTQLASCSFLEVRPSPDYADIDALSPNRLSRYRQLLYPVLHLCSALLTALGAPSHHEVCALVLQFLLSHVTPIVTNVLKANDYDHESLTELKLVTEILCQTTGQDFSDVNLYPNIPQVVLMEIEGHLLRIQRQFLSLLPHYFVSDDFLMNIKSKLVTPEMFEKVNLLIHEVACNILTYCRVITIRTTGADSTVLFSPTLAESSDDVLMFADYGKPTMGILVQILRTVLTRFEKEKEKMSQLKYKLENVDNLSSQELKEFMDANTDVVQLSLSQEQKLVATTLKKSMQAKGKVLQCEQYILETALLLLWQHLDHYVTNAASTGSLNENILFPTKNQSRFEARRLQDISNVVYDDQQITTKTIARPRDIEQLKTELPTCMTDSFLKKLAEIEMKGSFVRPLVRRMQCVKLRLSKQ